MFFTLISITTTIVYAYKNYFDADFDSDKNCKQLDLINKLRSETERCSRRSKGKYINYNHSNDFGPVFSALRR